MNLMDNKRIELSMQMQILIRIIINPIIEVTALQNYNKSYNIVLLSNMQLHKVVRKEFEREKEYKDSRKIWTNQ